MNRIERRVGPRLDTVDLKAPFLKLHLRNGDLYVLEAWTIEKYPYTTAESLAKWARFPQGLPPGIDERALVTGSTRGTRSSAAP